MMTDKSLQPFRFLLSWVIISQFLSYHIGVLGQYNLDQFLTVPGYTKPYYDKWCFENCSSMQECMNTFGTNDFVDLSVKIIFSSFRESEVRLMNDKYFGESISMQTFKTQFVLDVSSAISVSPCRIYLLSLERRNHIYRMDEAVGSTSTPKIIKFRIFAVNATKIRYLTSQIQNPTSTLLQGKVDQIKISCFLGIIIDYFWYISCTQQLTFNKSFQKYEPQFRLRHH